MSCGVEQLPLNENFYLELSSKWLNQQSTYLIKDIGDKVFKNGTSKIF